MSKAFKEVVTVELTKKLGREPTKAEVSAECKRLTTWAVHKATELGIEVPLPVVKTSEVLR